MKQSVKDGLIFFSVAVVGFVAVALAPFAAKGDWGRMSLTAQAVRMGVEEFSWPAALCLFVIGVITGRLRPGRPLLWGLATMALFPVWAFIEIGLDPTSHNLWPLEFIMYAVLSLVGAVGAGLGGKLTGRSPAGKH